MKEKIELIVLFSVLAALGLHTVVETVWVARSVRARVAQYYEVAYPTGRLPHCQEAFALEMGILKKAKEDLADVWQDIVASDVALYKELMENLVTHKEQQHGFTREWTPRPRTAARRLELVSRACRHATRREAE